MASAPSNSSFGAAASIMARAALIAVSEILPKGERAAAFAGLIWLVVWLRRQRE
jgi:hypothetical protein